MVKFITVNTPIKISIKILFSTLKNASTFSLLRMNIVRYAIGNKIAKNAYVWINAITSFLLFLPLRCLSLFFSAYISSTKLSLINEQFWGTTISVEKVEVIASLNISVPIYLDFFRIHQ